VYQDAATRFNSKKRRTRSVTNSEELSLALEKCISGDTISIAEGTYEGDFTLQNKNQVKITGAYNHKTILKGARALNIEGDECSLENITTTTNSTRDMFDHYSESSTPVVKPSSVVLIGENNVIKNLRIEVDPQLPPSSEDHGLVVIGESNSFTNVHVEKHHVGILINGQENKVSDVTIEECQVGLMIPQTRNELSNLTLNNVRLGVDLYGYGNVVNNVVFNYSKIEQTSSSSEDIKAINMTGRGHYLENVVCKGLEGFPLRSWAIYMAACTSAATVYNCGPGQVLVKGHKNYLENVDGAGMLKIFGRSHHFVNCVAETLVNNVDELPPTLLSKCKFGSS
jgi:hypothetical protein